MTKEIELAKLHGIAYRHTPEGTNEMWCTDRELQSFAEALVAQQAARVAELEHKAGVWKARCERRVADIKLLVERHAKELASLKEQQRGGVVLPERAQLDRAMGLLHEAKSWITPKGNISVSIFDRIGRFLEECEANPPGECVAVPRELLEGSLDEAEEPAQQRGGVDERAAFDEWFNDFSLSVRMNGGQMNGAQMFAAWQARARLNPPGECVAVRRDFLKHIRANCHPKMYEEISALLAQHGKAVGDE